MEKLKFFTFNNLRWKYRKFSYLEIRKDIDAGSLPWCLAADVFARTLEESFEPEICKYNLCSMIGVTAADTHVPDVQEWWGAVTVWGTGKHFVDAEGVAWPEDTFIVVPNYSGENPFCILVAPMPR